MRDSSEVSWTGLNPRLPEKPTLFCERCGLNFLPKQSVCTRCGVAPVSTWLQLMSLVTLLVAFLCNAIVGWFLLPCLIDGQRARLFFRAWYWFNAKASSYGWVPLAFGLLAWDYLVWRDSKPKIRGWLTRKLLTLVLVAGIAPGIPWWVPAGQPPSGILAVITRHAGLPCMLGWGAVIFVITLLCLHAQTRDSLLGHGRVLSLVSLGVLLLVLGMTVVGWSMTYR